MFIGIYKKKEEENIRDTQAKKNQRSAVNSIMLEKENKKTRETERQKQSKHEEAVSAQTTNVKIINLKRV